MEELLASQSQKLITPRRGQEIEGEVLSIASKEIILDIGAKSEGVIASREIPSSQLADLKAGSKLKVFVYLPENEHGQTVLSLNRQSLDAHLEGVRAHLRGGGHSRGGRSRGGKSKGFLDWSCFTQAQNQKSKLQGKVLEINKGGLIVEVTGTRGFLPNSQVGFELLSKIGKGTEDLIGQTLTITVIEIDRNNNKLIFSQRGSVSDVVKTKLKSFKTGQITTGKVVAILPFGLVVDIDNVEGLVFISDVSWERVEDLTKMFTAGETLEVKVISIDEELGRLNLSIKELSEDPFSKLIEKFPVDEVVKGEITAVSETGITVELNDDAEGFLPNSKVAPEVNYYVGKAVTMLVDSVDTQRRRINLVPFVTSTEGLIYK